MNHQGAMSIAEALGWNTGRVAARPVSGGSIAGSWQLKSADSCAFVKTMAVSQAAMLEAERDGLERLAGTGAIRTPSVIGHGSIDGSAWLALEWLDLRPLNGDGFAALGQQLCDLHRTSAARFGLDRDNFIGATAQPNTQTADWIEFLFEHRIGFQLELLTGSQFGFESDLKHRLRDAWQRRFPGYTPEASLLHGDLWGGNAAMLVEPALDEADKSGRHAGRPTVFDPAVHYGDRECDLAMADLFGGFDKAFFEAYEAQWPLEQGWEDRRGFYKLYHLLNHANLFGGHYAASSRQLIDELAA